MENDGLSAANGKVIERLIECINGRNIQVMDELFHDDAVMDWPQSGERVVGAANRRSIYNSFPSLPEIKRRRLIVSGDVAVLEATLNYGDTTDYNTVFIFEFKDERIMKETAYWSQPFKAPDWRAKWVERA